MVFVEVLLLQIFDVQHLFDIFSFIYIIIHPIQVDSFCGSFHGSLLQLSFLKRLAAVIWV